MTNKFDFYEIVKIISDDPKHHDINGKLGAIRGMVQNEVTHEWIYGISIYESDGLIRRVYEKYLRSTGNKADPKEFMTDDSIKVQVDPPTGKGYVSK
jgi:hypothetical protein